MEILDAALLGFIQGLTEFLPVSSSGHLVLFQNLLGLNEPEIFFDISVHVGTLVAVCIFFRKELVSMITAVFSISTWRTPDLTMWQKIDQHSALKLFFLIVIGTIPTAAIGLALRPIADRLFSSVVISGAMLLVTGTLLWPTKYKRQKGRIDKQMTIVDALCIGLTQGLAILPGISRSGSTIAVGLFRGMEREVAARYSFLLSIPAILGATVLESTKAFSAGPPAMTAALLGASVAAVTGYIALKVLTNLVKKGNLYTFAPYCWAVGIISIASTIF